MSTASPHSPHTRALSPAAAFSELVGEIFVDDIQLSSGFVAEVRDTTPVALKQQLSVRAGVPLLNDVIAGRSSGALYSFIVHDANNDRVSVAMRGGAGVDAAGNPTVASNEFVVYKYSGWFTTFGRLGSHDHTLHAFPSPPAALPTRLTGFLQFLACTALVSSTFLLALAIGQVRYMVLRFKGLFHIGGAQDLSELPPYKRKAIEREQRRKARAEAER